MLIGKKDVSAQEPSAAGQQGRQQATSDRCKVLVLEYQAQTNKTFKASPSSSKPSEGHKQRTPRNSVSQRRPEATLLRDLTIDEQHAALPCFMMEERLTNKYFHGRVEVMAQLDTALLPGDPPQDVSYDQPQPKHASLCGVGGVGKSEVASHFALTRQSEFDAIFWLSADTEEKLDEGDCLRTWGNEAD